MNRRVFFFNMALRDQPYFPLYADDFLTDEKLNLCSAATQGVFIKMLCIFHKSEPYGGILFKQKDKQSESMSRNFALKLARLLPFDSETIEAAVIELLEEGVLSFENDFLFQKRMVKDFDISLKRSQAAKTGGGNPNLYKQKDKQDYKQKDKQNTEYVNVIVDDNVTKVKKKRSAKKKKEIFVPIELDSVVQNENWPTFEKFNWIKENCPKVLTHFKTPLTEKTLNFLVGKYGGVAVKKKLFAIESKSDDYLKGYDNVNAILRNWISDEPEIDKASAIGQDVWSKNLNDLRKMREIRENNNLKLTQ